MQKYLLFPLVVLSLVTPALGQSLPQSGDQFERLDRKFSRHLRPGGLGFVIKIFTKDQVLHQAAMGLANLQTHQPNTPETNFNLASNTKQFTAGLALLLEQDGKLHTADLVSKYLPEFPAQYAKVTVENLIHHTSGLPEYWELCDGHTNVRNRDILDLLAKKRPDFEPGARFTYSNSGYVVLSEIIQRVTGRTFPEVLNERVFKPLGMSQTVVHDELTENHIPRRAIGYSGAPSFEVDDVSVCNYNYGDSSIYSSLQDYSKWLLALSTSQIFSASSRTKLFSEGKTSAGVPVEYGYGWGLFKMSSGLPVYEHAGSWQGFRTITAFLPTRGIWLTALSNCSDFQEEDVVEPYLEAALALEKANHP